MTTCNNFQKVGAVLLSDYILKNYGNMSHLKLQKLLYYCEAYHLAYFDESLINEEFEAWVHGPVCVPVYSAVGAAGLYNDIKYTPKEVDPDEEINKLSTSQKELITVVLTELEKWTGMQLEASTHNELPWIEARKGCHPAERSKEIISKETMRVFYKSDING